MHLVCSKRPRSPPEVQIRPSSDISKLEFCHEPCSRSQSEGARDTLATWELVLGHTRSTEMETDLHGLVRQPTGGRPQRDGHGGSRNPCGVKNFDSRKKQRGASQKQPVLRGGRVDMWEGPSGLQYSSRGQEPLAVHSSFALCVSVRLC